ncbi:unnamed protein product, partial [Ectocarpus sp. 12 AP-2014]
AWIYCTASTLVGAVRMLVGRHEHPASRKRWLTSSSAKRVKRQTRQVHNSFSPATASFNKGYEIIVRRRLLRFPNVNCSLLPHLLSSCPATHLPVRDEGARP